MKKHLIIELKKLNFNSKIDLDLINFAEHEIVDFMIAISNVESCNDAHDYFNYLSILHSLLSIVLFKYDDFIGERLRFFIYEYERIDLVDERKRIFNNIKKHIKIMTKL